MPASTLCPSCRQPSQIHRFAAHGTGMVELDLCFACHGMWFDPQENTRLAPAGVLQLFELLHRQQQDDRRPIAQRLQCPRCPQPLSAGYDVAKGGRYVTYRCAARHGRFSTFGSFMVEKGFVRHLTDSEIDALALRVGTINCSNCGGAVDIRKDHACPYCRSALTLLDPEAVDKALQRHAQAAAQPQGSSNELADALVALERERSRELRERQRENLTGTGERFDLLAAGIDLVWTILSRR